MTTSVVDSAIDLLWRNFLSPESWTKSQKDVPWFLEIPKFTYNTGWDKWKGASMPRTSSVRPVVSIQYRLVTEGRTDRHMTTAYIALAWRRAVKINQVRFSDNFQMQHIKNIHSAREKIDLLCCEAQTASISEDGETSMTPELTPPMLHRLVTRLFNIL